MSTRRPAVVRCALIVRAWWRYPGTYGARRPRLRTLAVTLKHAATPRWWHAWVTLWEEVRLAVRLRSWRKVRRLTAGRRAS